VAVKLKHVFSEHVNLEHNIPGIIFCSPCLEKFHDRHAREVHQTGQAMCEVRDQRVIRKDIRRLDFYLEAPIKWA
jgi:hypothetical protein